MANSVKALRCLQEQFSLHQRHLHRLTSANVQIHDGPSHSSSTKPAPIKIPCRTLFQLPKLPNPMQLLNKHKDFAERKIVGYSMEQMFAVVSEVDHYQDFVPWCKKSFVKHRAQDHIKADLVIGFPPVTESYTSLVTLIRPHYVRAECRDGKLFNYMITTWKFEPGLSGNDKTCTIDFDISFEFRSALHSRLATVFFDEVVRTMTNAFLRRAKICYGKESIKSQQVFLCS